MPHSLMDPAAPQTPRHDRATLADKPRNNPARTRAHTKPTPEHTAPPAYLRARARPISRARALPTNRHEGGSLT